MGKSFIEIHEEQSSEKRGKPEGLLIPEHLYASRLKVAAEHTIMALPYNRFDNPPTIVDVGCGYSDLVRHLPGGHGAYIGIEGIEWIAEKAKETLESLDVDYHLIRNDVRQVSAASARGEYVFALGVFAYFNDKDASEIIESCVRLLKVGDTGACLTVAYQDATRYNGSLNGQTLEKMTSWVEAACEADPRGIGIEYEGHVQSEEDTQLTSIYRIQHIDREGE